MPIKGFYSQAVAILLSRKITVDELEPFLAPFQIAKRTPGTPNPHLSGPGLLVPYRADVNGYLAIDVADFKWPDDMGDPKAAPELFVSWSTGNYGPFAWPGNLERATQHLWA